ncbi:MAG: phosphate ABC transporter permease PstA, partial [Candidatus Omnitrophica bacterium]|nr:phosphate ABC transporter permease PstA [Candidatus Omnitrophota bacterium]
MKINAKITEKVIFFFLFLATLLIVIPVGLIILLIIQKGIPAINWQFLTYMPSQGMRAGGIFPAIVGTIYLVFGAIIFALPIGLFAAIYLSEYAKENFLTRLIKLAIVNLAGVPSVVYGLFGLALFVVFFKFGTSILSGSLTLGIMILPIIITASKEALESVPYSFREVSLSLGASKWQTIKNIVLPNALPGILTGTILGLGRAA